MSVRGIEFELIWYDQDIVQYRFTCSNGKFCGQAEAYLAHDDVSKLIKLLTGFLSSLPDDREFKLGNFDPDYAGGGLRLRFARLDSAGHCAVYLDLRTDTRHTPGYTESVEMRIPIEPAAIDSFILGLGAIELSVGARAYLPMAA